MSLIAFIEKIFKLQEKFIVIVYLWRSFEDTNNLILSYLMAQNTVRMRENTDQKNSEYGHFSRSAALKAMILVL